MKHQTNNLASIAFLAVILINASLGCGAVLAKGTAGTTESKGTERGDGNLDKALNALKASYAAKKYKDVLAKCDVVFKIDKKNMAAHYYKGLAHQALGELITAEGQYLLVSKFGAAKDKPAANKALAALSQVKRKPTVLDFY
ncbi:MAG: hypothetical protein K8F91_26525, partial [Candidatus Obscuribacterales bacterium]|nr:hypothetical protein [Candidatus Obscuribacterales bacterium]